MITAKIKKPLVLSVLFFLPVLFLLFLYPSKHNYTTLDIVKSNIPELNNFQAEDGSKVRLENHLTVDTDPSSTVATVMRMSDPPPELPAGIVRTSPTS